VLYEKSVLSALFTDCLEELQARGGQTVPKQSNLGLVWGEQGADQQKKTKAGALMYTDSVLEFSCVTYAACLHTKSEKIIIHLEDPSE